MWHRLITLLFTLHAMLPIWAFPLHAEFTPGLIGKVCGFVPIPFTLRRFVRSSFHMRPPSQGFMAFTSSSFHLKRLELPLNLLDRHLPLGLDKRSRSYGCASAMCYMPCP